MKKGLSYVDWIISIGIFIIYIVIIFIVFKPALSEEYPPDYLASILKDNLQMNATWGRNNFTITPLFITIDPPSAVVQLHYPPFEFQEDNTLIIDDAFTGLPFSIGTDTIDIELSSPVRQTIYLIHSGAVYSHSTPSLSPLILTQDQYQYGISEQLTGFSQEKLDALQSIPYEDIKKKWSYPASKDFYINITKSITGEELFLYGIKQKSEEKKIETMRFNDKLLNPDSTAIPIIIELQVG